MKKTIFISGKGGKTMKKTILIFLLMIVLFIGPAFADTSYFNFTADHPWVGDYQGSYPLCWAAVASNMLAWSGWGLTTNSQTIFNDFYVANHYSNTAALGIDWYFNQYWPTVNQSEYVGINRPMSDIPLAIQSGEAIGATVGSPSLGVVHAITVWGYDVSATGIVDALWLTNSWSLTPYLERWAVNSSAQWWTTPNFYGDGIFYHIETLDQRVVSPVPEPATMLLLASGLIGLAMLRRKFKQ